MENGKVAVSTKILMTGAELNTAFEASEASKRNISLMSSDNRSQALYEEDEVVEMTISTAF